MALYHKFKDIISEWHKNNLSVKNIIVGFSGGPDSTCLLVLLKRYFDECDLPINIIAAHVFHDWGKVDRSFEKNEVMFRNHCIKTCKEMNISLEIHNGNLDDFTKFGNGSLEASGRLMRRAFFESLMQKHESSIVALAHTIDDNLETFFIKLIRGANVFGLSCMNTFDKKYFRPLLKIEKTEITKFLEKEKKEYMNDPSNLDCRFLRCRIRSKLMPILENVDKRFKNSVHKTNLRMSELKDLINKLANENIDFENKRVVLAKFIESHMVIKQTIVSKILSCCNYNDSNVTGSLLDEIIRFANNKKSNLHKIGNIKVSKKNGFLIFKH